jgi:PIN domain nuclease of toxin-antitoxin system
LWWVGGLPQLSKPAARAIDRAEQIGISAIATFEVAQLAERCRIELDLPTRDWIRTALALERVELRALTPEIAVDAAQLRFAGDPFDRVIYATARAADAKLVTADERIRAFDPDRTIW